jgi:hypothetical protein
MLVLFCVPPSNQETWWQPTPIPKQLSVTQISLIKGIVTEQAVQSWGGFISMGWLIHLKGEFQSIQMFKKEVDFDSRSNGGVDSAAGGFQCLTLQ